MPRTDRNPSDLQSPDALRRGRIDLSYAQRRRAARDAVRMVSATLARRT